MKKVLFGMMACAALCACTSDDLLSVADQAINSGDGVATYMTVRIKDVNSGTRAEGGDFAYGTADEQTVNNAYFYFYDDKGSYMAKGSVGEVNGTAESSSAPTTADGNIEWESDTQVAVWGISDGNFPTQMLTVLNQPSGVDLTNKSLETALATLAGTPWGDTTNGFVMSTSVYYNNGIVNTTALVEKNFAPEPVDLDGHYGDGGAYTAVDVYVERLAAKVGLNISEDVGTVDATTGTCNVTVTDEMFKDFAVQPEGEYVIQLQGFDVDAVARDAMLVKNISDFGSNWVNNAGFTGWNDATDFRCYWAESPNYGDDQVTYPAGNWKANTATEEDTDPLNTYLRYVDLQNPAALGTEYVYCGENTNTQAVIRSEENDSNMNCLTQVLMKAQFGTTSDEGFEGVDLVKYHGEYLTLADFEEDMIAEVEKYDFSNMIDDVADALETSLGTYESFKTIAMQIVNALEPQVYCKAKEGNDYEPFDSRFLKLYSQKDGRVSIWFETSTSEDVNGNTNSNHSDDYNDQASGGVTRWIPAWYTQTTCVKEAAADMDDYDFYFKFDESITDLGETILKLLETFKFVTVDQEAGMEAQYYLPLNDKITIGATDGSGSAAHTYTARNFFIRCLEREAAGIVDDWSTSGFPYFYNEGLMYYNVPIEHLASKATTDGTVYPVATGVVEAQYGVVRNHWYDITVTSVSDFGHAIADEEEVIVPQVEEDYYYVGAEVNILSWKMINQSVAW